MPANNEGVIFKQRADSDKSMVAREEDWLCSSFQCDHCWFQNLLYKEPDITSLSDKGLMDYIRRVNLDILWARAQSSVSATLTGVKKGIRLFNNSGIPPPYPLRGPWLLLTLWDSV
eukprot:4121024-Ditylum_brightwellii.AAC.1